MKLPYSGENITERLENQSAFPSQFINKNYAFRRFPPCPDLSWKCHYLYIEIVETSRILSIY